jgi:glucan biosynthesis protein
MYASSISKKEIFFHPTFSTPLAQSVRCRIHLCDKATYLKQQASKPAHTQASRTRSTNADTSAGWQSAPQQLYSRLQIQRTGPSATSLLLRTPRVPFVRRMQGCQMEYFQTKNPNLGKLWRVLQCPFGIF